LTCRISIGKVEHETTTNAKNQKQTQHQNNETNKQKQINKIIPIKFQSKMNIKETQPATAKSSIPTPAPPRARPARELHPTAILRLLHEQDDVAMFVKQLALFVVNKDMKELEFAKE
jgi:hypothetical protein